MIHGLADPGGLTVIVLAVVYLVRAVLDFYLKLKELQLRLETLQRTPDRQLAKVIRALNQPK